MDEIAEVVRGFVTCVAPRIVLNRGPLLCAAELLRLRVIDSRRQGSPRRYRSPRPRSGSRSNRRNRGEPIHKIEIEAPEVAAA